MNMCNMLGIKYIMIWEDEFYNYKKDIIDMFNSIKDGKMSNQCEINHNDKLDYFFVNLLTFERKSILSEDDINTNRWVRCFHINASLLKYTLPINVKHIFDEYRYFNESIKYTLVDKSIKYRPLI